TREEIAAHLWGNAVHVDVESGVNTAIRKLRSALKDSPENPAFIETVPGKGYRFVGGVRPLGAAAPSNSATIVVLPFQNLSSDPEQEYFSDGLTEETIAALGRLTPSHIRVIAWTSSMAYKRTRKTAAGIGAELGANYLIESTVRRAGQQVRITSKLIR